MLYPDRKEVVMSRRFSLVAVVIALAAIAAAGCGSSSSSKSANTSANQPATTPAAPSTPSTGTSSVPTGNVMPGKLSSSTPIDSPVLKAALVKKLASVSAIPAKDDGPIADCVV